MTVCVATLKEDVVKVAWPLAMVTLAARVVAPSVKVTVPLGVPAPGATAATVAVKVTAWPNTDGLGDELTVLLLEALFTTCGVTESFPVELPKLLSPLYAAVMVCVATLKAEVVKVAWPEVMVTLAASVVAPSVKVTVPVGVPVAGATAATMAVNVTACPNTEGLGAEVTVVLLEALFTTWGEAESFPVDVRKLPSPE